jgi:hypothetical protein
MEAGTSCDTCHDPDEHPAGRLASAPALTACTACHGNHGVVRATLAMLSPLPEDPCAVCHVAPGEKPDPDMLLEASRRRFQAKHEELVAEAGRLGLEGDERFDWLVEQAQAVEQHKAVEAGRGRREGFHELFDRFRVGKTHYSYDDPASGKPVRASVLRCGSCHSSDSEGARTSQAFSDRMHALTRVVAQSERFLLRARRGGVDTSDAPQEIRSAVDAEVELAVLVHTFHAGADGKFVEKHRLGMEHAESALAHAHAALEELGRRWRGLVVSLAIILVALGALALKIRALPPL